ncbi:MAG: hypothetical protein JWO83_1382 [Caulobacteraceae bacterium]|nr:hypothetical protein [Caulobacteraceae bacterium]
MVIRKPLPPAAVTDPATHGLLDDEAGVSAVAVGLCLTAMLGFAGMAVDVGVWYADKRAAQGAADSAAFSAGQDLYAGDTATGAAANAKAVAAQYGFTHGVGGVTVTVNTPPTSGPNTSTTGAVEVIVQKSESLFFSGFYRTTASIGARAVAVSGSAGGGFCVEALDTTPATTVNTAGIDLSNGANLDLSQCGLQINASGSDALVISGGAKLIAQTLSVVGTYSLSNGGQISVSGTKTTGASALADPYANVSTPTPSGCSYNNTQYNSSPGSAISPGTYCNGLVIGNGSSVTMNPGVYIIDRGTFQVSSGSTLNAGAGVTIVLTSSTGSSYANAEIDNGANVTITAPSSGATSGMAIMQDRNTPYGTVSIAGGSKMNVTGALYFPTQMVNFSNGSTNNSACTQLIAWRVNYAGGSKFGNNCTGVGTTAIGSSSTVLKE